MTKEITQQQKIVKIVRYALKHRSLKELQFLKEYFDMEVKTVKIVNEILSNRDNAHKIIKEANRKMELVSKQE